MINIRNYVKILLLFVLCIYSEKMLWANSLKKDYSKELNQALASIYGEHGKIKVQKLTGWDTYFKQHKLYWVEKPGLNFPPQYRDTLAIKDNSNISKWYPNLMCDILGFNAMVKEESVNINDAKEARQFMELYLLTILNEYLNGKDLFMLKILNNFQDTYRLVDKIKTIEPVKKQEIMIENEKANYNGLVKPPTIRVQKDVYFGEFYTWRLDGGILMKWSLIIKKNGEIKKVGKEIIAENVGAYVDKIFLK